MRSAPDTEELMLVSPAEARWHRARVASTAMRLDEIWRGDTHPPIPAWDALATVPAWALSEPRDVKRIALVTGALFAAPTLRVTLDATPLHRVRKLIGAAAFELVMETPDLPTDPLGWTIDATTRGPEIYVWSASLLLSGIEDPLTRSTLVRSLGLSGEPEGAPLADPIVAARMTVRAIDIVRTVASAASQKEDA